MGEGFRQEFARLRTNIKRQTRASGALPAIEEGNPLAKNKKPVDEALVDKIVKEQDDRNLKEKIYDQLNVPIWLLDIVIVACLAGLAYIIFFKRA